MNSSTPSVRSRPVRLPLLVPLLVPLLAVAIACGGGGGGSPTDPGSPAISGTASIQGQVSVAGGSGNLVAEPPGGRPGTSGPVAPGASPGMASLSAADSTGAGVVVRIQGTSLATTADGAGNFSLGGVPEGNQVLVFETSQASAGVPVDGIQPNEHIQLSVRMSGGSAEVTDIDRDGGDDGTDPGAEDPPELNLSLQLSPNTWNLNYAHSSGTVAAFIRGQGFRDVVLSSIVLVGDNPDADPLEPVATPTRQGNNVRARFAKNQVLDILEEPEAGSVHTVTLQFEVDGVEEIQELTAEVRIVGQDDSGDDGGDDEELGDLSLQLSPSTWNLNYSHANGSVTAFIRGQGLDAIDTDSVQMVGDNPEADPLDASSARLEGNHIRAQFPKNKVLDLLDEPHKGSMHTVTVLFTSGDGAESHELEAQVKVVGGGN